MHVVNSCAPSADHCVIPLVPTRHLEKDLFILILSPTCQSLFNSRQYVGNEQVTFLWASLIRFYQKMHQKAIWAPYFHNIVMNIIKNTQG